MTFCKICGEHTIIPDNLEDTGICNLCAQEEAKKVSPLHDQIKAAEAERDKALACAAAWKRCAAQNAFSKNDAGQFISADEKILNIQALESVSDCGKGWRSPEDYEKLEAACAELRDCLARANLKPRPTTEAEFDHALSLDCGQSFIERHERLRKALVEISKGEGEYNHDAFTFANNTIESMKSIAREALKGDAS